MKIDLELEVPVPAWARRVADGTFLLRRGGPVTQGFYEHWPVDRLHAGLCWLEGPKDDCPHCGGHGESDDLRLSHPERPVLRTRPVTAEDEAADAAWYSGTPLKPYDYEEE